MNFEEPKDANERSHEDRWLDEALAHYSAAEPRPGLENRILANLEAHVAERQRRWFYAFATAAAVLLFAVVITTTRNAKDNNPPIITTGKKAETTLAAGTKNAPVTSQEPRMRRVRHPGSAGHGNANSERRVLQADVKQEHFPVDQPLSEQDRLLLAYLSRTPPQEMEHLAAAQQELAAARQRWEEEIDSQERR